MRGVFGGCQVLCYENYQKIAIGKFSFASNKYYRHTSKAFELILDKYTLAFCLVNIIHKEVGPIAIGETL